MKKNNFILNAKDLASYICYRYFKIYTKGKKEISPIKLQKSLYFLFAYWGGFVRKNNNNIDYVEEKINQSEYLFEDEFHAWNLIKIGNEWYNADATWDTNGRHEYFLKSDESFSDHKRGEEFSTKDFCNEYPAKPRY